jgi:hypothetical protein
LTRIHIHNHEINQGRRILELNQHILCYAVELHYSGVCQSQLMRGRDQWVLVQAVIDLLGQDDHVGSPIIERMMVLEWPQDARNTVGSAAPLRLFRSLSMIASLLILNMGIFFPSDGCARIPAPLDASHLLWVG